MTIRINPEIVDLSHYDDVKDAFAGAVKFGIRGVINKLTAGIGFATRARLGASGRRLRPGCISASIILSGPATSRRGRVVEEEPGRAAGERAGRLHPHRARPRDPRRLGRPRS